MRPTERIEKSIKKLHIAASDELDSRVNEEINLALAVLKTKKPAGAQPNIWRIIIKSRITKLTAAAAMIIIAICLCLTIHNPNRQIETPQISQTTDSPAGLTTLASLNFAYRQGGMERVEQMCDKALKMAGQRPANISMQEFFEEINNGKSERTEL